MYSIDDCIHVYYTYLHSYCTIITYIQQWIENLYAQVHVVCKYVHVHIHTPMIH